MQPRKILLSGIAPSGRLTLGNYLGAIKNWVDHQHLYRCFFPLVDLHAITVHQDPETFSDRCRDFVALYLACGVDPRSSVVFVQSQVSEHCELAWILQCFTQVGELGRMTQFKLKARRHEADVSAGLFGYPTLMAADILLYKSVFVPVGEDQRQHLELTRDIAQRFNGRHGPVFPLPEAHIPKSGARIMSLQDPDRKMSKSDPVDANVITLLDSSEAIVRKIKRCVTDSGKDIVVRDDKPGISNLLNILASIRQVSISSLEDEYRGVGYGRFKQDVADAILMVVEPIQRRFSEIRADRQQLDEVLRVGAAEAKATAQMTLAEVHRALGFIAR